MTKTEDHPPSLPVRENCWIFCDNPGFFETNKTPTIQCIFTFNLCTAHVMLLRITAIGHAQCDAFLFERAVAKRVELVRACENGVGGGDGV
jgi:hypothetical protein